MRAALRVLLPALALAATGGAGAQEASKQETRVVQSIVECLVVGLPEDWVRAEMIVELAKPGASTGEVRYLVARKDAEDQLEPYTPCDFRKPARTLLETRNSQKPARRGWTGAKLLLQRDGKFAINYDYPKKDERRSPK
jgi:hypothetical protein